MSLLWYYSYIYICFIICKRNTHHYDIINPLTSLPMFSVRKSRHRKAKSCAQGRGAEAGTGSLSCPPGVWAGFLQASSELSPPGGCKQAESLQRETLSVPQKPEKEGRLLEPVGLTARERSGAR